MGLRCSTKFNEPINRISNGTEIRYPRAKPMATHRLFAVQPTTFLEFAERNAEAFGGRVREGALA